MAHLGLSLIHIWARQAKGLTVIIDVFRAFSLECYLMAKHPAQLCPVGAKETAYAWKENHPEAVLIGERHGVILPGFQYGNSPFQTEDADLEGKTLILSLIHILGCRPRSPL